ncbi:MAG TPA: radical SAM family heme chaperone HemW [Candidatus Binatia bacterium]|nr:radical SAM family heme chaperone HemW [Candidatus Binatia bacterium]
MSTSFALYVHVPWCRRICPYCDFNVYASRRPPEGAYTEALVAEIAARGAAEPWAGRRVRSVYLGGGTPSLFSPAAIGRILEAAAAVFGLVAAAEVTIEANPGTVDRRRLAGYRAAGVNRLSLGAQSFAPAALRVLGRDHTPGDTAAAVAAARAAGIANVSLDLIFAVPGTTCADWEADLARAIALGPEHVSAYGLTYEEGTPLYARRARGRVRTVDEATEAAMAEAAAATLAAAGYERYEISSWARPGFASRHNASYWDGSDYLGVGAGAHSFAAAPAPGRRWANRRLPAEWRAAVAARGSGVAEEERLTAAQARGEFVLTGLRRIVGVDLVEFERRFVHPLAAVFPHVARLRADGLVEESAGRHLRLTARGLLFADSVAATFV